MKRVHIIVNPKAGDGKSQISIIKKHLEESSLEWEIFETKKASDIVTFAKRAKSHKLDALVVYGGDGTVAEVARILFKSQLPMVILPGGTANVIAKEYGIPVNLEDALRLLIDNGLTPRSMDMGVCNGKPFLNRVNIGFAADMEKAAPRKLKKHIGQLAYGVAAAKKIIASEKVVYDITIDAKHRKEEGVALMVANSGNIGISGLSILPHIKPDDGKLDVVLLRHADIAAATAAWTKSTILKKKPDSVIGHWAGTKVTVNVPEGQSIASDDIPIRTSRLKIHIAPKVIQILVPK